MESKISSDKALINMSSNQPTLSFPPDSDPTVASNVDINLDFQPPELVKKKEEVPQNPTDDRDKLAQLLKLFNENKDLLEKFVGKKEEPRKTGVEKSETPVKPIKFFTSPSSWVLPRIGTVVYPFSEPVVSVSVGSSHWLQCLDKLRASGWPATFINKWLDDSAAVVLRDGHIDVYEMRNGVKVNRIEEFAQWWPDPERRDEQIKRNWGKLINDIKKSTGNQNPFAPVKAIEGTGRDSKQVYKPMKLDFTVGNTVYRDFLRNWTRAVRTDSGDIEMRPPVGMEKSWIPIEYHEEVEVVYDLVPFYYLEPELYTQYLTMLSTSPTENPEVVMSDSNGNHYIYTKTSDGTALSVTIGEIKIKDQPKSSDLPEKMTLREWLKSQEYNPIEFAPLHYFLLNADAPKYTSNSKISDNIYDTISQKGNRISRMYADAPVSAFASQLVEKYLGNLNKTDDFDSARQKFIANAYSILIGVNGYWQKLPNEMPISYAGALGKIFDIAVKKDHFNKTGNIRSTYSGKVPVNVTSSSVTQTELRNMSFSEKTRLLSRLGNQI